MKYIPILLLLASCNVSIKCWSDDQHIKEGYFEVIDMGGVSTFNEYQLSDPNFKFSAIDTKKVKKRTTKYYYKNFDLHLRLWSNNDTGDDLITVLFADSVLYSGYFGEFKEISMICYQRSYGQLEFIVSNPHTPNYTAGAFSATITVKRHIRDCPIKRKAKAEHR